MAEKTPSPARAIKTNTYEGMFLFGPSATADNAAAIALARGIIERHGGTVLVIKKWDERKLAFEVKKQKRGTYVLAYFTAVGDAITPMERDVKLNDEILRVLITEAGHLTQAEMEAAEPQPIIREERPSWDRPSEGGGYGGPRRDDRGPRGPRQDAAPAPAEAGAATAEAKD